VDEGSGRCSVESWIPLTSQLGVVARVVAGAPHFQSHGWGQVHLRQERKGKPLEEEKEEVVLEEPRPEGEEGDRLVGQAVEGTLLLEPELQLSEEDSEEGELVTVVVAVEGEEEEEMQVQVRETAEEAQLEEEPEQEPLEEEQEEWEGGQEPVVEKMEEAMQPEQEP
jgi:hypothetical protein